MGKPATKNLNEPPCGLRDVLFTLGVATGLLVIGHLVVLHRSMTAPPGWFQMSMDATKYIAMVEGRLGPDALYGPRVLIPFLASHMPLRPDLALMVLSYGSLFTMYALHANLLRRLGCSRLATTAGLLCMFGTLSHLINYSNPFLTDAFALMALTAMFYFLVTRRDRLFGVTALIGLLGRETVMFGVPAFAVTRRWRWCIGLTVLVLAEFIIPRYGNFDVYVPPQLPGLAGWTFWAKLYMSFGFLWLPMCFGLVLCARRHVAVVWGEWCALFAGAVVTSLLSADTIRMIGVLQVVAPVVCAMYIQRLAQRSRLLAMCFVLLVAVNICWAVPTVAFPQCARGMWELEHWYFRLQWPIIIYQVAGLLLCVGSVYCLRDVFLQQVRDKLGASSSGR